MLIPTDLDNWSHSESSNSDGHDAHHNNDGHRDDRQPRQYATRSNSYAASSPSFRAGPEPFNEHRTMRLGQAPTFSSPPAQGIPDIRNPTFSYGRRQPLQSGSISVDINSNNVHHTSVSGIGNTRSSDIYAASSDTESSLSFDDTVSSISLDSDSEAGTPWAQNSGSGITPPAVPHRRDNGEPRDVAVAGGQACPGYVVDSYRLGDGTLYSSAHACEHNNARCERTRRQLGVEDRTDLVGEQPREPHSPRRDEISSRTELRELLREDLHLEGGEERDHPPPYSPHPPQESRQSTRNRFTGARSARQGHENGAFSAVQVVDNGSGYTSQNVSINGNNIDISTRVAHGNHGESTFYSGIPNRSGNRRVSTPRVSYTNIRQSHGSGWVPETMNGPHFPDMSGMSQWIEQMVQQPLRAMNQQIAQSSMSGGGWHTSVSMGNGNTQFYHAHDNQRDHTYSRNGNLPNRNPYRR
ncbi:hypothetical protein BJ912DRAFT_983557, partial [Pholiota molesta]